MQTTAKTLSDVPAINRFLSYCRVRTVPSKTVMIHFPANNDLQD